MTGTETRILEAAKKVFEKHGYTNTRMQQIADEAGISKSSLHYYFRFKEHLFERIFEDTLSGFRMAMSTWSDDQDDSWEDKVRHFISELFHFLKKNELFFVWSELHRNPELLMDRKNKGAVKSEFISYFENLCNTGKLEKFHVPLVYILLHSLCGFPLISGAALQKTSGLDPGEYDRLMERYPNYVAEIIIRLIKDQVQ